LGSSQLAPDAGFALKIRCCLLFAFIYAFCGAILVVSLGISDHDGQDGEQNEA